MKLPERGNRAPASQFFVAQLTQNIKASLRFGNFVVHVFFM